MTTYITVNTNGPSIATIYYFFKMFSVSPIKVVYAGILNRYKERELFFQWIEDIFIENTKHLGKSLLMLDEYGSHLYLNVIDHCLMKIMFYHIICYLTNIF